MREDLLHFIWKTNKLTNSTLLTTSGETVHIINPGLHNQFAGPDFFNAKVEIDDQLWAGTVEMHLKTSDWYAHHHETDTSYDNVILHVVWEDDVAVFRSDGSKIPTLELRHSVPSLLMDSYRKLLENPQKGFINCEKDITSIPGIVVDSWLERLYVERLEQKAKVIYTLLEESNNDWEQVLFALLLKNFGSKVNGPSFMSLAKALDFSVVRKVRQDVMVFESVLFGLCGLLDDTEIQDTYYEILKKEFKFQQNKFGLNPREVRSPEFFGLRPNNFPTIRLSQLANLYAREDNLFSKIMEVDSVGKIRTLFAAEVSPYWKSHFTFGKVSKESSKKITKSFIDLIIINTIVPLKFAYAKKRNDNGNEQLISLLIALKAEQNSIVNQFKELKIPVDDAFKSQAVLQLYNKYCVTNGCLKCSIGTTLLRGNP